MKPNYDMQVLPVPLYCIKLKSEGHEKLTNCSNLSVLFGSGIPQGQGQYTFGLKQISRYMLIYKDLEANGWYK